MKFKLFLLFTLIQNIVHGQMEVKIPYLSDTFYGELNHKGSETLVIFIAGSGPTDRDGNGPGFTNNSLKELSDSLVANGISTFRFDKRGVGKSYFENLREENVTIDTLTSDILYIKNRICKLQSFKKIYLLGHSEGSLLGILASTIDTTLSGLISLAGAGKSADSILMSQMVEQPAQVQNKVNEYLTILRTGNKIPYVEMDYYTLFRPSVQPYMISWIKYNPKNEIAKLIKPILILQGDSDIQVDTSNANILHEKARKSKLFIIKNMNHILKKVYTIDENLKSYNDPRYRIHEDLPKIIVEFLGTN